VRLFGPLYSDLEAAVIIDLINSTAMLMKGKDKMILYTLLALATLVPIPAGSADREITDNVCLNSLSESLSQSGWSLKSAVEQLDGISIEDVRLIHSVTFKRTFPTRPNGSTFPRFRVDQVEFISSAVVPLFDDSRFQIHELESTAQSVFPASDYYAASSGMSFSPGAWSMSYAMYRSFRNGNSVFIVYTDAELFLNLIDEFTVTIQELVSKHCPIE